MKWRKLAAFLWQCLPSRGERCRFDSFFRELLYRRGEVAAYLPPERRGRDRPIDVIKSRFSLSQVGWRCGDD